MMQHPGYPFPSDHSFFGLGPDNRELFLEHAFVLQFHLGMSYSDIKSLPIPYRTWFIDRLVREFEDKKEAQQRATTSRPGAPRPVPMGEMSSKKFK